MRAEIRHEEEKEVQMLKRIKKKRMAAMIFSLVLCLCGNQTENWEEGKQVRTAVLLEYQ